jgi:hypothetical protein
MVFSLAFIRWFGSSLHIEPSLVAAQAAWLMLLVGAFPIP